MHAENRLLMIKWNTRSTGSPGISMLEREGRQERGAGCCLATRASWGKGSSCWSLTPDFSPSCQAPPWQVCNGPSRRLRNVVLAMSLLSAGWIGGGEWVSKGPRSRARLGPQLRLTFVG